MGTKRVKKLILLENATLHATLKLNLCISSCREVATNGSFNKHTRVHMCNLCVMYVRSNISHHFLSSTKFFRQEDATEASVRAAVISKMDGFLI